MEANIHAFCTLVLDGDERSASCSGHYTPREIVLVLAGEEYRYPEPVWMWWQRGSPCPC